MSDHTLKRLTKKFFSPTRSTNRLKTTDSEGRLGRKHERSECLAEIHIESDVKTFAYRERCENICISITVQLEKKIQDHE